MLHVFKCANMLFQSNVIEDVVFEDFLIDYEELEAEQDDHDFYDYVQVCIMVL